MEAMSTIWSITIHVGFSNSKYPLNLKLKKNTLLKLSLVLLEIIDNITLICNFYDILL